MKRITYLSLLTAILLAFSGCNLGLDQAGNSHNAVSAQNIRSATLDPVSGCTLGQTHQHNGEYYSGHYNNDGHGHSGLAADNFCTVSTCAATDTHTHNGIHYAGHNNSCGHSGNGNHGGNCHHG
jgi:hypothetical protein